MIPEPVQKLADAISELPSIGPRQAIRLAFYIANGGHRLSSNIAKTLLNLSLIKQCQRCFYSHQGASELCSICSNNSRNNNVIAVIEKETDLIAIEKAGIFNGRYFIIGELRRGGILNDFQKERLEKLKSDIANNHNGVAEEIILAISPTTYGDLAAATLARELHDLTKKISRLGRGIPTGGEIEFADEETMRSAIERRR